MNGAKVILWHGDSGQRIALQVAETAKYLHLIILEEGRGVRLFKAPRLVPDNVRKGRMLPIRVSPACYRGDPYPIRRAVAHFKRFGQQWGISPAALNALKAV